MMGAADEEVAGDQQLEKAARSRRGVARISARGPRASATKAWLRGVCKTVRRARAHASSAIIARSQAFSFHCEQCASAI